MYTIEPYGDGWAVVRLDRVIEAVLPTEQEAEALVEWLHTEQHRYHDWKSNRGPRVFRMAEIEP